LIKSLNILLTSVLFSKEVLLCELKYLFLPKKLEIEGEFGELAGIYFLDRKESKSEPAIWITFPKGTIISLI